MASKAKIQKRERKIQRAKDIKIAKKFVNVNIAAFDQATKCGVAYQQIGYEPVIELWDLSIKTRESQGMKWLRFETRLRKFLKEKQISVLAYELPAGRNINPIIHSSKLIAIIEKVCVETGVEYIEFTASEIKKFATNNGNAPKSMMIEYAKKLWGYKGKDDNEADALHILHLLKTKLNYE